MFVCLMLGVAATVVAMLPPLHAGTKPDAYTHAAMRAHPERADVFGRPVDHCKSILSDQAGQRALNGDGLLRPEPRRPTLMFVQPAVQHQTAVPMPCGIPAAESSSAVLPVYLATERLRL